ncbi:MAG: hypothetical protein GEU26_18415 [Nitrososphaeraceae archaeon]|nr:hypothetical protein [Nitrososphaeraceae archaeon]
MPSNGLKSRSMKLLLVQPRQLGTIFENMMQFQSGNQLVADAFSEMAQNIVYPIAITPLDEFENTFERFLTPFQTEVTNILELISGQKIMGKKIHEIEGNEFEKFIGQFQSMVERDSHTEPMLRNVFDFVVALNEYVKVLITNSENKPDILDDVLAYKIDVNDLQKYVLGSLMAYFCFLILLAVSRGVYALPSQPNNLDVLLPMVLSIGKRYNDLLLSYMKAIDALCNRQRINQIKPLIHTNPKIAGIVGRALISELPEDYKVKNRDRFIAIDYGGNIMVEADTLEELDAELDQKNVRIDCYIDRLGHNYITRLDS